MRLSLVLIAVLAVAVAVASATQLDEKIKRSASQKLYYKGRPMKEEKALLEKPTESKSSEEEEESTIDSSEEESEEESEEGEGSQSGETRRGGLPFDFNQLFTVNKNKLPDLEEVQKTFSKVWGNLFGKKSPLLSSTSGSGEEEEGELPSRQSFISQVLSFAQPWWKGENVCSREETFEEEDSADEGEEGEGGFFSSLSTTCRDVGSAYKCTMSVGKEGKRKVRTLIYECCHGWGRETGQKGCTKNVELKDVTETLRDMNLTEFVKTAESVGLQERWASENLTLFVPTNAALTAVTNSDDINFVVSETDDKLQFVREILLGHMVEGWQYSHDWEDEKVLQTEGEDSVIRINFYTHPRPFATANCARITSTDRKTLGGLVHSVDKVLLPARQSLWDLLGLDARFSTFVSLIPRALQDKLMDASSHYTVLAFTDEAFEKLPQDIQDKIKAKDGCAKNLINEMIIPHTICSAAIQGTVHVRTLAGRLLNATRVETEQGDSRVEIGGVGVAKTDRVATNGVVHLLDKVIVPDHVLDVVRVAEAKGGEVMAELLQTTEGLAAVLRGMQRPTLFVPPNAALLELPEDIQANEAKRAELLKNHIVDNKVEVGLKNAETLIETEAGQQITMKVRPLGLSFRPFANRRLLSAHIGCARILRANVKACGGLVHFIDRPLTTPSQSLMEVLRSREDLSEFLTLLEMSEVSQELNGEFSGTVLAPTNDAIADALTGKEKERLLADKDAFKAYIRKHILTEPLCCHSLGRGFFFQPQRHSTLGGSRLHSQIRRGDKYIGGSRIESCDGLASNGLVHTLSSPLPLNSRRGLRGSRRRHTSIFDWPF